MLQVKLKAVPRVLKLVLVLVLAPVVKRVAHEVGPRTRDLASGRGDIRSKNGRDGRQSGSSCHIVLRSFHITSVLVLRFVPSLPPLIRILSSLMERPPARNRRGS